MNHHPNLLLFHMDWSFQVIDQLLDIDTNFSICMIMIIREVGNYAKLM
jgi:hypothetical protein